MFQSTCSMKDRFPLYRLYIHWKSLMGSKPKYMMTKSTSIELFGGSGTAWLYLNLQNKICFQSLRRWRTVVCHWNRRLARKLLTTLSFYISKLWTCFSYNYVFDILVHSVNLNRLKVFSPLNRFKLFDIFLSYIFLVPPLTPSKNDY